MKMHMQDLMSALCSRSLLLARRCRRAAQGKLNVDDHHRGSRVDRARGRRRSHHRRVDRQGLSGSALRRGEAELHPQAAEGRSADRRRPRARDRLAAAADSAEPQREDSAGRGGLSRCVAAARTILEIPTGQVTRAMGDVHPLGNPHYWIDPENGKRIAKEIADKLSRAAAERQAPTSSSSWPTSRRASTRRKSAGSRRWRPYKGTKVVTYHRSFPNFAERFGLDIVGYVEPRPGIPPTPQHTLDLINEMKRQNVKMVLVEPYFDLKTPNAIGRDTGAQVLVMPPSVGGVKEVHRLLQAVRLRHQPAGRRDQEERSQVSARHLHARVPGGAVRRQPDPRPASTPTSASTSSSAA